MGLFGGQGMNLSLRGAATNRVTLESGQVQLLSPAGWYGIRVGGYTTIQQRDPVTGIWWKIGGGGTGAGIEYVNSDGVNYRLANQTGCVVGGLLTNKGSGYTSPPTVTTTGGAIWQAVLGGAVATSVTVTNAGANYTYPPQVVFSAPPQGGIQATGYCTLSTNTVSSVTVTNQGAGYTTPPTIVFINDPREGLNGIASGYNAAAVATLTGSGTVTGLYVIDHGQGGQTSVPSVVFSGGGGSSAAATAIMCWSILSFTPTAGTGFTGPSLLSGLDAFPTAAAAYTNPATQSGLVSTRPASILLPESGGAPTATGAVFYDGGIYTSVPTPLVTTNGALITQTATFTFGMGGQTDTNYVQQY